MNLRDAAQAALDALDDFDKQCTKRSIFVPAEIDTVFDALRTALAADAMQQVSRIGQEMENAEPCEWEHDGVSDASWWDLGCGAGLHDEEDGPRSYMTYCYGCGKRIKFKESDDGSC